MKNKDLLFFFGTMLMGVIIYLLKLEYLYGRYIFIFMMIAYFFGRYPIKKKKNDR